VSASILSLLTPAHSSQEILRPPRGPSKRIRGRSQEGLSQKVLPFSLNPLRFTHPFFFSRALRLHPDKGGDPELFKEVTHALVSFPFPFTIPTF
jgi:hypothetical protein